MKMSFNNKLILKPYEGERKIRANISSGFAKIQQKTNLIGLELLVEFKGDSIIIPEGATVFFKEELLYNSDWSRKTYDCPVVKEKFILAEFGNVICIN